MTWVLWHGGAIQKNLAIAFDYEGNRNRRQRGISRIERQLQRQRTPQQQGTPLYFSL
jgi:hypothetical protein